MVEEAGAVGGRGGDLPRLLEGRKVSMLCDMLMWSRQGSWRARRRLTEAAGGEKGEHVV